MQRPHILILKSDSDQPVAMQVSYEDWLEFVKHYPVERSANPVDLSTLAGSLKWGEDAVAYQRRVRESST